MTDHDDVPGGPEPGSPEGTESMSSLLSATKLATDPSDAARPRGSGAWDLLGLRPLVLFVDGVASRAGGRPELLCAWTLTREGRRELLALEPGQKDAPDRAWAFLAELKRRGLADPILVVTDGESPLFRASEISFATSLVQRCLAHHLRALSQRVPADVSSHVLHAVRAACEAPSPSLAATLRRDVARRHGAALPALVGHFERTFESCTTHLSLPRSLHRVARATLVTECVLAAERRLDVAATGAGASIESLRAALAAVLEEGCDMALPDADHRELEELRQRLARRAG